MEAPKRPDLEEYAESLDLSPDEVLALLESALHGDGPLPAEP
jgi:hypothetical protein